MGDRRPHLARIRPEEKEKGKGGREDFVPRTYYDYKFEEREKRKGLKLIVMVRSWKKEKKKNFAVEAVLDS